MDQHTTNQERQGATQGMGTKNGESRSEGQVVFQMASGGFAKVICDSVSDRGIRITTFHLRYWRAIHAELMTHRVFSRNARSSRAVPSRVLLTEPIFIPVFGMNKPGMQSDIIAPDDLQMKWRNEWQDLAAVCRDYVERWSNEGMHKQHANRPLEWFGWIDVLVTSTYWDNFWTLRISEYAQPEFDELARCMKQCMGQSIPTKLLPGEWHLPYVTQDEISELIREGWDDGEEMRRAASGASLFDWYAKGKALRLSTARCARLSYRPFDGNADYKAEEARYEKLVVSSPVHASPAEHQATPDTYTHTLGGGWDHPREHGNFIGWRQHRKQIRSEAVMEEF